MNAMCAFLFEQSPWNEFWSAWLVGFCIVGDDGGIYLTAAGQRYLDSTASFANENTEARKTQGRMSQPQPRPVLPRLAYLTSPSPGVILLNLQFADGELPMRVELTQRQLASILVDGTAMALRALPSEAAL